MMSVMWDNEQKNDTIGILKGGCIAHTLCHAQSLRMRKKIVLV